jgi:two-component system sensor histidine kinase CiaH
LNRKSIERIKKKFILTAMISFLTVMLFIAGCIYIANLIITRHQIRRVFDYIEANDGVLPERTSKNSKKQDTSEELPDLTYNDDSDLISDIASLFGITNDNRSPEFYYSTRYFAVIFDKYDNATTVITSHIASVDDESAEQSARAILKRFIKFGAYGDFYYNVHKRSDGSRIVTVLDCSTQIAMSRRIVFVSIFLIGIGMLISFLIIRIWANKIVQPEIKNAEMQKAFITDASHELKTPLAVIRANTEMLEMSGVSNEWTESTLRQVKRLTGLIQNLVTITRAQEKDAKEDRVPTDITAAVSDTVSTFMPVASQDGKTMTEKIEPDVTMMAHEGDIRQLSTILIDNAIKYCDEKGNISVVLETRGRRAQNIVLMVSNSYADGADVDYSKFFARFYRGDKSHNTDKGGYGIGLSIAESLMNRYHGDIDASYADGMITFTCTFQR